MSWQDYLEPCWWKGKTIPCYECDEISCPFNKFDEDEIDKLEEELEEEEINCEETN